MLYRKYRSQKFSEIIGQDNIVRILKQSILEGRLAHAYLFSGPRGTGKTSMARILAKAINCTNPKDGEPCDQCANCKAIQAGKFLDLIEIDAASNRGIEEIRDLKEKIGFLPVEGKYKVYIIDEVHMLTGEAFNALLKTLEEPPKNVVIILATTEAHKLPATILSRVQRFDFKLANESDLIKKLSKILEGEGFEFEAEALELIAQGAMGSFRDSETLLDKVVSGMEKGAKVIKDGVEGILGYTNSKSIQDFVDALVKNQPAIALKTFNLIFEGGVNLVQFVKQVLEFARAKVIDAVDRGDNKETREYMLIIKEFSQVSSEIKFSLLPRVMVEMAVLNLSSDGPTANVATANIPVSAAQPTKKVEVKQTKPLEEEVKPSEPVDMGQIKDGWVKVVDESRSHNHHLVAMLSGAKIKEGKDGELQICVPYAFHKNRLTDAETKKIMQSIFKKVYGKTVAYTCVVDKELAEKAKEVKSKGNEELVEDILK